MDGFAVNIQASVCGIRGLKLHSDPTMAWALGFSALKAGGMVKRVCGGREGVNLFRHSGWVSPEDGKKVARQDKQIL